jgi:hypothetical protein
VGVLFVLLAFVMLWHKTAETGCHAVRNNKAQLLKVKMMCDVNPLL